MIARLTLILGLFAFLVGCSDHPPHVPAEFVAREVTVDGKARGYRVFVPPGRNPNEKLAVMLYLHGSGARGDDNTSQVDTLRWSIEPVKDKVNLIVVLPQCREETFWSSVEMSNYVLAALDATVSEFNGDRDRLYLSGFSLGGYGTWQIAAGNPGKFAALIPIAGGIVGQRPIDPEDRAVIIPSVGKMLDSPEPYKAVAEAIGKTPVWIFHGAKDDAVPVDFARKIVKTMEEAGSRNVKYTEFLDGDHLIVGRAFSEPGLFEWLTEQRLASVPTHR